MENIGQVVRVSSGEYGGCRFCGTAEDQSLEKQINHYLQHGCRLLHVGSETTRSQEGAIWHCTVAVLGLSKGPTKPATKHRKTVSRPAKAKARR